MTTRTLAVTGSTGQLGGLVARRLADAGVEQRLVVRDLARAPELPRAHAVRADYADREAVVAALDGVDAVFMVSAHEGPRRLDEHFTFIDAAVEADVGHVVYTSFLGASPGATFTLAREHWATEQRIEGAGLRHTFLRNSLYLDLLPHFAGDDGVIRGPAGDGLLAAVAVADIAEVAATVLLEPDAHAGRTYQLTGAEALSLERVAETISEVTGRQVTFHHETVDEAYASRAVYGAPDWQNDAWVSTYTAIANGELAEVADDVEALTGHPPTTLAEVLRSAARHTRNGRNRPGRR